MIGEIMVEKYEDLRRTGWEVSEEDVARDVRNLLGDNFKRFVGIV